MTEPAAHAEPVQSPCIGVCTVGPENLCIGCLRSVEEIGGWLTYSEAERRGILAELPARLESLFSR